LKQLVLSPGVAHFKASSRRQSIFYEQGGKVKTLSPKPVHTIFSSGICNLLNGFQSPAKNQLLAARLKNFQLSVRKTC